MRLRGKKSGRSGRVQSCTMGQIRILEAVMRCISSHTASMMSWVACSLTRLVKRSPFWISLRFCMMSSTKGLLVLDLHSNSAVDAPVFHRRNELSTLPSPSSSPTPAPSASQRLPASYLPSCFPSSPFPALFHLPQTYRPHLPR